MLIFHDYVSLPEGTLVNESMYEETYSLNAQIKQTFNLKPWSSLQHHLFFQPFAIWVCLKMLGIFPMK